jgi:hypothetical protein
LADEAAVHSEALMLHLTPVLQAPPLTPSLPPGGRPAQEFGCFSNPRGKMAPPSWEKNAFQARHEGDTNSAASRKPLGAPGYV